jgi:predicted RNA-binding Zn ribbon-like protein
MTSDDPAGSTTRLLLAPAPGGLCVVQDLLNSRGMSTAPVPDLLADGATAQTWLDTSLRTWGEQTGRIPPVISLSGDDPAVLRDLRGRVRGWLGDASQDHTPQPLDVEISFRDGRPTYQPRGDGAAAVASLVLLEALLASHTGTWSRLKTCLNPSCGATFYDLSRNSTRVWHDMKTCGNTMNLRASRARRREAAPSRRSTPAPAAQPPSLPPASG